MMPVSRPSPFGSSSRHQSSFHRSALPFSLFSVKARQSFHASIKALPAYFPGGLGPSCTPHEMHRLVTMSPKGGGYRVLDIRTAVEFEYAHLTKVTAASGRVNGWNFTVNVPLETAVDEAFLQDVRIACPEKSRGVVVVDANGSGNAHDVAEMLKAEGYAATTVLHGGWALWLAYFDSTGRFKGSYLAPR